MESLRFSMYKIISSANRILFLHLQFGCLSFFSLIILGRISSTSLNKSAESECLCLVPDFRGNTFWILDHWVWCSLWVFHIQLLLCWGSFLLFLLWVALTWKGIEFCQMLFLHQLTWSCGFFFPFIVIGHILNFFTSYLYLLNHPYISGINPTWSWYIILLIYCWLPFAAFYWRFLPQCSQEMLVCSFLVIVAETRPLSTGAE